MKKLVLIMFLFAITVSGVALAKADLDLNTPEGAKMAGRKVQCSVVDGEPVFYWWKGKAYSRRQGEADKNLFNVEGMNVRTCLTLEGGKQGKSYRIISREILLYTDAKTGQPLETWVNPWSGEEVAVHHVLNDPVNNNSSFPLNKEGKAFPWTKKFGGQVVGNQWSLSFAVPLFYHNPLGGEYQKEVGGVYHATEMFTWSGAVDNLVSADTKTADAHIAWVRISDWLPWMKMSGREGAIYFTTSGFKVDGFEGMGEVIKEYINAQAPKYKEPPPLDDKRPNETSWIGYKNTVKGQKFTKPKSH
jgi:hypothetical protein